MANAKKTEQKDPNENFVSLSDIYKGYQAKADAKNPTEVDIIARHDVEFTEDFVNSNGVVLIKKGHRQLVSTVSKDWYNANKVIKIHSVDNNKAAEKTTEE